MTKKPIKSSNLAIRFYKYDGWTEEEVQSFILDNQTVCRCLPNTEFEYYIFPIVPNINLNKLLNSYSTLSRKFDDYPNETDEQFIKRHL